MPKKQTIRFYTSTDRYVGWNYLHKTTYFDIVDWIRSYNYIMINEQKIHHDTPSNQIFALLRKK